MKNKISFNNGFITAITLFLEHKENQNFLPRDKNNNVITDIRLYGASDHLCEMEIPEVSKNGIKKKLRKRIIVWRDRCFKHRLNMFKDTKITDELFKEAEDILAKIDQEVFHTKKVVMNYR